MLDWEVEKILNTFCLNNAKLLVKYDAEFVFWQKIRHILRRGFAKL